MNPPKRIHEHTRQKAARYALAKRIFDASRDAADFRAELRDRLDRCTDSDHGAAFGWLTDNHPDLVREALDETGAPE